MIQHFTRFPWLSIVSLLGTRAILLFFLVTQTCATPAGNNLALKKPTQASSSLDSCPPSLAVDGALSVASKWTSAEGTPPPHTLIVDLGMERPVTGCVVSHAGAAGELPGFNTQSFKIETANLLTGPWTNRAMVDNPSQENVSTILIEPPAPVRFVRLVITDPGMDDFARIPEFEVYGPELPVDELGTGLNSNSPINSQTGDITANSGSEVLGDTGAAWVRVNFILGPWSGPGDTTPHGSGNLTWFATYDKIINGYVEQGVQVYGLIGAEAVRIPSTVEDQRAFVQTAGYAELYVNNWVTILEHFRDRVRVVECFNEPNNWAGGTSAIFPPDAFARLLARLYLATKVGSGHSTDSSWTSLTLVTGPLFTHNSDNGASFWQETINAGRANHSWDQIKSMYGMYPYDGIGIHYYIREGSETPAQTVAGIKASANAMGTVTRALEGSHTKRFYCSEFGFRDDYTGSREATVAKMQACYDFFRNDSRYAQAHWFSLKDFPGTYYGLYEDGDMSLSYRKDLTWCSYRTIALGDLSTGTERLENGGFETGSLSPWTTFGQTDGVQGTAQYNVGPYEGSYYFGAAANNDQKNGGAWQRVSVTPGRILHARAFINTYREGEEEKAVAAELGVDPSGGTDPESSKVVWSRPLESPGCHVPLDVKLTAQGSAATVFLRHQQNAPTWNVVAFDTVSLIETEKTGPPTESGVQYYDLVP